MPNHRLLATLFALAAPALLAGCPKSGGPTLAALHVTCSANGKTFDANSEPPDQGQACPPGSTVTLSYDNDGSFTYLTVFAVTREDVVFFLPGNKDGQSISIQPSGKNVPLPDSYAIPAKTRDIMALFTKEPLRARDVEQRTRDVSLGQIQGAEVRVRLSKEYGPIN